MEVFMKKISIIFLVVLTLLFVFSSCATKSNTDVVYSYTEKEVQIPVGEVDKIPSHTIPGILTLPEGSGKFPAVVMLHGTGSNKNEAGNAYDTAAPEMAKNGIATLRIDFMGSGDSKDSYEYYCYTSANIDALASAEYLKALDSVDVNKIGVMGWSQGGTNALLAAASYPEVFSYVITWSGALDLRGEFSDFDAAYESAKKNGYIDMTFDWRDPLPAGVRWFDELVNTDVLEEVKSISAPLLAINGDLDEDVPVENAYLIAEAAPKGKVSVVEGADHTYNVFSGDTSTIEDVIDRGIKFIKSLF